MILILIFDDSIDSREQAEPPTFFELLNESILLHAGLIILKPLAFRGRPGNVSKHTHSTGCYSSF